MSEGKIVFVAIVVGIFLIFSLTTLSIQSANRYAKKCAESGGIAYQGPYQKRRCISKESVVEIK